MTVNDRTRAQLLGYLLDALEDSERQEVERQLESNRDLRDELDSIATTLEPLAETYTEHDPPGGLAARTCTVVEDQLTVPASAAFPTSMAGEIRPRSRWCMADVVVLAGICLAAAMLFFPAIAQSRYSARLAGCENNLRELGIALINYSEKAGRGYFPKVPIEGNQAFAGIYGPVLRDSGYLSDPQYVICPSSTIAAHLADFEMPTLIEIDGASGTALIMIHRTAGGSYAYNLGVVVDGQYRAARNQGRTHFALMADSPSRQLAGYRSSNHGGRGQNFLYEDGHVQYVVECWSDTSQDHPFENRLGWTEAGVDANDAVVGPSFATPFVTNVSNIRSR
ncbi:MAG: hypothetical protein CMJ64_18015 [Planctomycetaceae bacterium]|nr:hypothetical protein [Planctomycetaceae bacterium]